MTCRKSKLRTEAATTHFSPSSPYGRRSYSIHNAGAANWTGPSILPTVGRAAVTSVCSHNLRRSALAASERPGSRLASFQFNFGGSSSLRSVRNGASMHACRREKPASVCA
jgi:hypothetical protein